MNLPYLALVEQSRALKEDAQMHASFLNTALHNAEIFGSTNMLLDISLPSQNFPSQKKTKDIYHTYAVGLHYRMGTYVNHSKN